MGLSSRPVRLVNAVPRLNRDHGWGMPAVLAMPTMLPPPRAAIFGASAPERAAKL